MGRQEAHGPKGQAQGPPMGLSMSSKDIYPRLLGVIFYII